MAFAAREQLHYYYQACFPTLNIMEREKSWAIYAIMPPVRAPLTQKMT